MSEAEDDSPKTNSEAPDLGSEEPEAPSDPNGGTEVETAAAAAEGSDVEAASSAPLSEEHRERGPAARTEPLPGRKVWWLRIAGLGIPLIVLFSKIGAGGIWDPHELDVADYARRIAIQLWGAQSLVLADTDNTMPTLQMLGKGELPFTSIALGFASFGLHEWAGRLPLALWGFAGVLALYWFVKRMVDEQAAAYATIVLSTVPLYFVQARTMLGDIVTMAALTMAIAGLSLSALDTRASGRERALALLVGLAGVVAGYLSRGALIGVAIPLLTVGLAWTVSVVGTQAPLTNKAGAAISLVALAAGLIVTAVAVNLLLVAKTGAITRPLGLAVLPPSKAPTFDLVVLHLGHGLFPWSAFIPFAVGRLFRPPSGVEDPDARFREVTFRAVLLVGACVSFGVFGFLTTYSDHVPFAGVALLAGIAAVAIRDLERGAPASRTLGLGVVVFLALFFRDFRMWPDKGMSAFGVSGSFPDTFKQGATSLILSAFIVFAVLGFASWLEKDRPENKAFDWSEYLGIARGVRTAANGNVMFTLIVVEAALAGFAILFTVGMKLHWKAIVLMSSTLRRVALNGWWAFPVGLVAVVLVAMAYRDLCRLFFTRSRVSRASATLAGGALAGAILSFSYYPALASQLSPKEVFESYRKLRGEGDELALLGVNSRTASYYSGGDVQTFTNADSASRWLQAAGGKRRWLVLRHDDLPRLNSMFRKRGQPPTNLPILDARSSQIMLASNRLGDRENSTNPINEIVLSNRPQPAQALDVDLEGKIKAIGWEIVDGEGKVMDAITAGRRYRFRLYYEVTGRVTGDWKCFIHIDGQQRRFNGDHKPMGDKYPMSLWQPGDVVVDDYPFSLEPNFTPGRYMLYYGFFIGDRRLKIVRGKHHENRIEGGHVQVQ